MVIPAAEGIRSLCRDWNGPFLLGGTPPPQRGAHPRVLQALPMRQDCRNWDTTWQSREDMAPCLFPSAKEESLDFAKKMNEKNFEMSHLRTSFFFTVKQPIHLLHFLFPRKFSTLDQETSRIYQQPNGLHTSPGGVIPEAALDKSPDSPSTVLPSLQFVFLPMAQKNVWEEGKGCYWMTSKLPKGRRWVSEKKRDLAEGRLRPS